MVIRSNAQWKVQEMLFRPCAEALEVLSTGKGYVLASRATCRQYLQKLFCWETKTQTRVDSSIFGERVSLAS